jgi:hypothetical protein
LDTSWDTLVYGTVALEQPSVGPVVAAVERETSFAIVAQTAIEAPVLSREHLVGRVYAGNCRGRSGVEFAGNKTQALTRM